MIIISENTTQAQVQLWLKTIDWCNFC